MSISIFDTINNQFRTKLMSDLVLTVIVVAAILWFEISITPSKIKCLFMNYIKRLCPFLMCH